MDPMKNKAADEEQLTVAGAAPEEEAVCDEAADEAPMTPFQKRISSWSERKWIIVSGVCGALLGGAVMFFLFGGSEDEGFSMFSLYAIILALFVPKTLRSTCGRSIRFGETMMLFAMVAVLIVEIIKVVMK